MAGVRFKSLQAATPLLDEQFDQILFVVNLAHFPTTFRCQIFYANRKQTGRLSNSVIDNRCNTTPRPCVRQINTC